MRPLDNIPTHPNAEDIERDLIFVGLLGLLEPIRQSAIEDIKLCNNASFAFSDKSSSFNLFSIVAIFLDID